MRETTIFEKIVAGEIPCTKIRENDEFIAILDIFPNCKGQTLVFPKEWHDSHISLMPDDVYSRYMLAVKEVIWLLKKWLQVDRVGMIVEGEWVPHVHVKLYPMHEWDTKPTPSSDKVRFDQYPWYLTSKVGNMKSKEELDQMAQEIANRIVA
jgi:histidine triad (HIT) family protein